MTQRPSIRLLPSSFRRAATEFAERLGEQGERAWIVGGAVRDLALGLEVHDLDLASAAEPELVARVFGRVHDVGRAFGTTVVRVGELDLQHSTFRTETGYSDARRPDEVRFAKTLEEDARRRDFTCNAIFLDPRTDEVVDPTGGLADLEAGRLRCVGVPADRFREDGLRLVRLVRFAVALGLEIEAKTREAAHAERESLRGVSPERMLAELVRIAEEGGAREAAVLFEELGLFSMVPGVTDSSASVHRLRALASPPDAPLFFALLYEPAAGEGLREAEGRLARLRPSNELARSVRELWKLAERTRSLCSRLLEEPEALSASARIAETLRIVRDPAWPRAQRFLSGHVPAEELERFEAERKSRTDAELFPEPWITSAELAASGIPRGARWGELLEVAEERRLAALDTDREAALEWLRREARSAGGEETP